MVPKVGDQGVEWSAEGEFGPLQPGVWHSLAIHVGRDKFEIEVGGDLVLARDDPNPFLRGGATVSLVEDRGKTFFDNIGLKTGAAVRQEKPEPAPAPEPEEERGFLINRRPGEEALAIEALLDPVTLTIISIFVTIAATFTQIVRGR